ncbi:MAG: maltotransferase domain-containing protein [Candidatus Melainabacteria bacterium]|jgi:starch synthase (maltosyl-transferring)
MQNQLTGQLDNYAEGLLLGHLPSPIIIEQVSPEIDNGKYPIKCLVGETIKVSADIFKDGHDILRAQIKYKAKEQLLWNETEMSLLSNDLWQGSFQVTEECTTYLYTIEVWVDALLTCLDSIEKRCKANLPEEMRSDLAEALKLMSEMNETVSVDNDKQLLQKYINELNQFSPSCESVLEIIYQISFQDLIQKYPLKRFCTQYDKKLEIKVERKKAVFGSWYELFPRSQSSVSGQHGTFRDCIEKLPYIAKMGFDVLYLPPIHPIGKTNRKGKNNSLITTDQDPGSPWAIGSHEGGHKSIHPELGSLEDFRELIKAADELGLEIAIDFAIQCTPDHPYVKEHPEWFYHRADGTIKYAENPPKKYQDIYPLDFHCKEATSLWNELKSILLYWIEQGIKIFRVDNPHTKPMRFWQWLIAEIHKDYPEVIFLSEAFTMPKPMKFLAKVGFTQSYSYFTWRNTKEEITEYSTELTQSEMKNYYRGNFFPNTPDILPYGLQNANKAAFKIRLFLAATLSSIYGIYQGYEFCENQPLGNGKEEYLNSEKYEIKYRPIHDSNWLSKQNHLIDYITLINKARKENAALQEYKNLEFYECENPNIIAYGKYSEDRSNQILCVVNLNPNNIEQGFVKLPLNKIGIDEYKEFRVKDLITGESYYWNGSSNYVRLDPSYESAHLFLLERV